MCLALSPDHKHIFVVFRAQPIGISSLSVSDWHTSQSWYARWWRRGVAVECQTRDQEVVGSRLGGALRRKNSRQVSHTYVPLSTSSIIWYRRNLGGKQARCVIH